MQQQLIKPTVKYSKGRYNVTRGDMQKIRLSEGCPHNCAWCYEPQEIKLYLDEIDSIERNNVIFSDMNFLSKESVALEFLKKLGSLRHNGKPIYYEFECGIDYRFLTQEIAEALYKGRFGNFIKGKWVREIKIAWDNGLDCQYEIKDALKKLKKAGFKHISAFMIVNHYIPMWECELKLDMLKVWGVKVDDCCFDGGYERAIPRAWTEKELKLFRHKCALHNQLVGFGLYPNLDRAKRTEKKV